MDSHSIKPRTFQEYTASPPAGGDWVIPGLIPGDGWTMIQAPPKTGKSILGAQISHSLTTGESLMAWKPVRVFKTLYIQVDAPPGDWYKQLIQLGLNGSPTLTLDRSDVGLFVLDDEERRSRLTASIAACGAEVVVWDALEKLTVRKLNEREECQTTLRDMHRVWSGPSVVIHHPRKLKEGARWDNLDEAAGHPYLTADASSLLTLKKENRIKGLLKVIGRLEESLWRLDRDPKTYAWISASKDEGPTL